MHKIIITIFLNLLLFSMMVLDSQADDCVQYLVVPLGANYPWTPSGDYVGQYGFDENGGIDGTFTNGVTVYMYRVYKYTNGLPTNTNFYYGYIALDQKPYPEQTYFGTSMPTGALGNCDSCPKSEETAKVECGFNLYVMNTDTCNYYCKCQADGEETEAQAGDRCAGLGMELQFYSTDECKGYCGCSEAEYQSEIDRCGDKGVNYWIEGSLCSAVCNDCNSAFDVAQADCNQSGGYVSNWVCQDSAEGSLATDWSCVNPDTQEILPSDTKTENNTQDGQTAQTPTTQNGSSNPSDTTDSNQWLASVKENQDKQIEQLNTINNNIATGVNNQVLNGQKLDYLGKNLESTTTNTKSIADGIASLIKNGIKTTDNGDYDLVLNGIKDRLNTANDRLDGTTDGAAITAVPDNIYNGLEAETDYDPTEPNFQTDVSEAMTTPPLLEDIADSHINISSSDSCLDYYNPFTHQVSTAICFNKFDSTWTSCGYILLGLSYLSAIIIVAGVMKP